MKRAILIGIGAATIALPGDAQGYQAGDRLSPSVDCANTALGSHYIICSNAELSASERSIADLYEAATGNADTQRRIELQSAHRGFTERRDACDNSACVAAEYARRREELLGGSRTGIPASHLPAIIRTAETQPQTASAATAPDAPAVATAPEAPATILDIPPEPINDPSTWILQSDYPDRLQNGEAGLTRYVIRVGDNGLPATCYVTESSGHWELDSRACRRAVSRARFHSARDTQGNAVAGVWQGSFEWRAPSRTPATSEGSGNESNPANE